MTTRVCDMTPEEYAAALHKRRMRDARRKAKMTPAERAAWLASKKAKDRERYAANPELYREMERQRRLERKAKLSGPEARAHRMKIETLIARLEKERNAMLEIQGAYDLAMRRVVGKINELLGALDVERKGGQT